MMEKYCIDPVMVSTSGSALMKSTATKTLIQQLLPLADVINLIFLKQQY